jgi:hypothetical protein
MPAAAMMLPARDERLAPPASGEHGTPAGNRKWFARARERVDGPVEAVCAVALGGPAWLRLASAALTDAPQRLLVLVLTADDLFLFVHRERLWPPRVEFGDQLLRVPFDEIVRVAGHGRALTVHRADGSELRLRAVLFHHGPAVADRLVELVSARRR